MILILAASVVGTTGLLAQDNQDNQENVTDEPRTDAEGCTDLQALPKLSGSISTSCRTAVSAGITVPLPPDSNGNAREKYVEGRYEFREYQFIQPELQEQAFDNLKDLLPIDGFLVKYSEQPSVLTARNENTWILIRINGEFYNVSVVQNGVGPFVPVGTFQEIANEMEGHKRVAIYGIHFSPDDANIVEDESIILREVMKYFKSNPDAYLIVYCHKWGPDEDEKEDQVRTDKRAKTLLAWLEAHGIQAAHLQAVGVGRSRPLTDNDTPSEIEQNDRIELILSK